VKAYAVVKATINKVNTVAYCPLRTAQCGMNPTCNHPKRTMTTLDIQVKQPLFSTAKVDLPKGFTNYAYFQPTDVKQGDTVYLSLYVYAHEVAVGSNSNISKMKKIEADGKAPPATPRPGGAMPR
jgi:hypothetical protein